MTDFIILLVLSLVFVLKRSKIATLIVFTCILIPLEFRYEFGSLNFNAIRILALALIVRSTLYGEKSILPRSTKTIIALYSISLLLASFFHDGVASGPAYICGLLLQTVGILYSFSIYMTDKNSMSRLFVNTLQAIIIITPVMVIEKVVGYNFLKDLFEVQFTTGVRNEEFRASGPFLHPILAGISVSAAIPFSWAVKDTHPFTFKISLISIGLCIYASNSSSPFIVSAFAICLLFLHKKPGLIRPILSCSIALYLLIEIMWAKPAFFQIARIDFTGGSSSWYRAELLYQFIRHFKEWYLFGIDYTKHWMMTGLRLSENHTDLTNHYVHLAVQGGLLPLLLLIILLFRTLYKSPFALSIRASIKLKTSLDKGQWAALCTLTTFILAGFSASFYDQTSSLFFATIAVCYIQSADKPRPT
jgi:hypothetical protein